jgi:hypothetical protein
MHLVADVHDTPVRRLSSGPGLWRGFTHAFPFQRSVSGFPRLVSPTAVHFLADVHDTPISKPSPGTDWTVHLVPFHAFASLAPERSLRVPPTAVQARAAGQDTPASASWVAAAFRLASTDRVTTLPPTAGARTAAGTPGVIDPAAFAGAAPSSPAAISPAAAGASRRSQRPGTRNGVLIKPMSTP